jgi:hypothetical protein
MSSDSRGGAVARVLAGLCLAGPFAALLWVPSYAKEGPALFGMPFFYWYQFAWVPMSIVLMTIAYLLLRGRRRNRT